MKRLAAIHQFLSQLLFYTHQTVIYALISNLQREVTALLVKTETPDASSLPEMKRKDDKQRTSKINTTSNSLSCQLLNVPWSWLAGRLKFGFSKPSTSRQSPHESDRNRPVSPAPTIHRLVWPPDQWANRTQKFAVFPPSFAGGYLNSRNRFRGFSLE
jgi:hypothetical protein